VREPQVISPSRIDSADAMAILAERVNSVYITIGSTSMSVARVKAVPNAPMEVAKHMAPEEINPGVSAGIRISLVMAKVDAPRERAASSKLISIFSAAAITVVMTLGMEKYKYPKNNPVMEYAKTSLSPITAWEMLPTSPWRPTNRIIINPTTTPGNANGKVNMAIRILFPKKLFL
jgi:hypothetical protein